MGTKVKKSLYGIKQASVNWFYLLKNVLERGGYHKSQVGSFVFYMKHPVILTYVDDCVIFVHKQ